MTDKQLYRLCKKYGTRALKARWKFAGLLPEVYKRRLYERRGFHSIYEFAARIGGLSRDHADNVLRLERRFEDKPVLKEALISGEVSVNKLARVVSIATPENQEDLVEKANNMSSRALEVFVKDFKEENGLDKAKNKQKNLHVQTLQLDEDVEVELRKLQQKGININELLREFLNKRKLELAQEKEELASETTPTKSRYINVKVRKYLRKEHGTKCSIRNCNRPAEHIHHTQRFALARTHDPRYLAPLCRGHHEIAHTIDRKYQTKRLE